MTVITVTTPLSSVDDSFSVITVGKGVVVTKKVVGVTDETDGGWEELCNEDSDDGPVPPGIDKEDEGEQLAKSVEIGLASVMMLVMIRGTDIVEIPPDITVVPVFVIEETQVAETVDKHEEDTKVEVVSGSVCTVIENVVTTVVEVTVVNKVRVGVGVHAAMKTWSGQ